MSELHRHSYSLRVMGPAPADLKVDDGELWAEIERDREPHDDDLAAVQRWLGDLLEETADKLNALLPEGWYAKIEEGAGRD